MSNGQFPDTFMFGVATADHQCEAYDPNIEDIRDVWETRQAKTPRGKATDFWNRYAEDIALAQSLGCKMFRFSIAWSRVEPKPGEYNEAAFEHYRQLIETIRAAGMEPIVTLHHFTWPIHVEQRGGLLAADFPTIFETYTTEVAKRLGALARYWITFNEPSQLIYGYIKPFWERAYFMPPGLPKGATTEEQIQAVGQLIPNLFKAHTKARTVLKQWHPEAQVGANPMLLGLPLWLQWWVNRKVKRLKTPEEFMSQGKWFAQRSLVEQGAVDVAIATFSFTPERASQVAFSEVYYISEQSFLVQAKGPIQVPTDLDHRTVAVIAQSTAEIDLPKRVPTAIALTVADAQAAKAALDSNQAAAILADNTLLQVIQQQHPGQYQRLTDAAHLEPYAAAVAHGNRELLNAVDGAIRQFKESGAWAASFAQHFPGQPVPEPPRVGRRATLANLSGFQSNQALAAQAQAGKALPLAQPNSALRRIQSRDYIKIAIKENIPGLSERDPITGELKGLEIDLARAIAQYIFNDSSKVKFIPTTTQQRLDLLRSPLKFLDSIFKLFSIAFTSLNSNWWHLGMAGELPEFLCPKECHRQQDFVGFDYYWGISTLRLGRIQQLMAAASGRFDNAPVWSGVLYNMVKFHAKLFPDKEILIIENGCVEEADGINRGTYLRKHLREVQRAQREGFKIIGYVCWCITSNREWGLPFNKSSDFGLYHIDLDHDPELKRMETKDAILYKQIIQQRSTDP